MNTRSNASKRALQDAGEFWEKNLTWAQAKIKIRNFILFYFLKQNIWWDFLILNNADIFIMNIFIIFLNKWNTVPLHSNLQVSPFEKPLHFGSRNLWSSLKGSQKILLELRGICASKFFVNFETFRKKINIL